jgi:peptidoglycan/xylan/chitin deacetylase (PgdA/CDA1 family)
MAEQGNTMSALMRARLVITAALVCLLVASLVPGALASKPADSAALPLTVASASLTQSAQQLVLKLRTTTPFSTVALRRQGRSLCLLIEAVKGGVTGRLCVIAPVKGRPHPRLVYQAYTGGQPQRARVVAATVRRAGADGLSATFLPSVFGNAYRPIRWQVQSTLSRAHCTPVGAGSHPTRVCQTLYPARGALATLHTPQLIGCVPSGPAFVNSGPSTRREIALTFDDGPWYDTPQFLDILEHYHVPATFFEIGEQISTYGEGGAIERRMLADGDMVGDHSWSHPDLSGAGAFARGQILQTASAIQTATDGFRPCLFRAPYGAVSGALISEARSLGFTTIQWDVDTVDWSRPGTATIESRAIGGAHPGAIILQHDGGGDRSETLAALPDEITTLTREGYHFVTVTQLLGQKLLYK